MQDPALVAAVLAGDRTAGDRLVQRHAAPLRELIRRHFAGRKGFGPDDVENVFQQTWLGLLQDGGRRLRAYDAARPFLPFLLGVGLNACRDHLKAERYRRGPAGQDLEVPSAVPGPSAAVEGAEERRALGRALGDLTTRQRLALQWVDADGLGYRQVAALLGIPLSSCRDLVLDARRHLKGLLEGKK